MTKAKSMTPKSQASTPKDDLKGVKNTPIGKNKTPKFKKTPTGKVALINGTTKGKGNQNTENNTPKGKVNTPLNTPKPKGNSKPNTPNNNQASPGNKKKIPVGKSPARKPSGNQWKCVMNGSDDEEDSDTYYEDINEGVEVNEDVSDEEADSNSEGDEVSNEDVGIIDILGNSLAEDSDDDDSDFDDNADEEEGEEEEDEEEEEVVNKGVKQFKGLKPSVEQSDDAEEEEEEDSGSDGDTDDSVNDSGPGLKALLGQSLADDDDDEDFTDNDEEEDDDEDISDEEEDEDHTSPIKKQKVVAEEDDDEDEEEDSDDDEEDEDSDDAEDDTETSKLSMLENDSENDDEEEDDDDEDLSDGKSADDSGKELTPQEVDARNKRSIYVGNLPKDVVKEQLIKLFKKFGTIEVIRIRGGIGKDSNTSKKLSVIKRDQLHPVVSSLHAYIRYHADDAAKKALSMNGHKFNEFFLRVDLVGGNGPKPDQKKAVFLGNLPFKIDDNSIWSHFADCGKIVSVRIVRDKKTKIGKGFGYINFENTDSVALALKLNGTTLLNRVIRVNVCTDKSSSEKKQGPLSQKRSHSKQNQGSAPKRHKDNSDPIAVATHNSQNAQQRKEAKQQKRSQGEQQRQKGSEQPGSKSGGGFQGQKADKKKKQKFNKFDKKKKQIAAKFAAKPK